MFSSLLFDGFLVGLMTPTLSTNIGFILPRTIILTTILLSFHYKEGFVLTLAGIFGFIMDTYYLGFIGVYMASLIMIAYITFNLRMIFQPNVLSYVLMTILGVTLVEFMVYGIMSILGVTSLSFQMFIVSRFTATLVFNTLIMLVFSHLIHLLILKVADES